MDNKELKNELLAFITLIEKEVAAFVEALSAEEKKQKGSLKQWSAKDVFSHLAFWGVHFNTQLTRAKAGEQVPAAGDYGDAVNDGVLYQHINQPFTAALKDFKLAFNESAKIINEYTADELNDTSLYEYLNNRTIIDRALGTLGWHVTYHLSDFYMAKGSIKKAVKLQENYTQKLKLFPSWEANSIYNLACFYAGIGETGKALENLKPAFIARPDLIKWAEKDTDLDPIRDDPDFKALIKIA